MSTLQQKRHKVLTDYTSAASDEYSHRGYSLRKLGATSGSGDMKG